MLNQGVVQQKSTSINSPVWRLIDWLFPPLCCDCGRISFEICPDCLSQIHPIDHRFTCKYCGQNSRGKGICTDCCQNPPDFDALRAWADYNAVVKTMITHIKYQHRIGLIPHILTPLLGVIKDWGIQPQLVVPVPLGPKRQRSRGYNQAALIARPIARALDITYAPQALLRIRETRSQVGLHAADRQHNLAGAFLADQQICQDKSILLVDDIATTGTTLRECARALKQASARQVYAFTVARTNLYPNSHKSKTEVINEG